jgi:transcriptional regulator with XRE-family HTH domain
MRKLESYLKQVGRNLKAARVRRGYRQQDIEELIGLNNRHYQSIEAGKVNVRVGTLRDLAKLFKTTVEELAKE